MTIQSIDLLTSPVDTDSQHDGATCTDIEALLAEATMEIDILRSRLDDEDRLRREVTQSRALVSDLRKRLDHESDTSAALKQQNAILLDELQAAEADTIEPGSLTHAAIDGGQVTALYRQVSRITRGPVPPAILTATQQAAPSIAEAMHETGIKMLAEIVRREHRRRRRAQAPSRRVTPPRPRRTPRPVDPAHP